MRFPARGSGRWIRRHWLEMTLLVGLVGILAWYAVAAYGLIPKEMLAPRARGTSQFSGDSAYRYVRDQVAFGPRPTGSDANRRTGEFVIQELKKAGWTVEVQEFTYKGVPGRNIVGKAGAGPVAIVGAHYDTRRQADNDPDPARRGEPVMGANDGASGAAVLLELARSLSKAKLTNEVHLVFFDAEDNGRLDGWDFIAGSRYMAAHLNAKPEFVIVLDMIGDADQQIYKERNSTPALQDRIWALAGQLGYGQSFIPQYKWAMLDDHTPFIEKGIPAADLIDFDYPYWHTTQDLADKVAPSSLERVGRVMQKFLEENPAGGRQ